MAECARQDGARGTPGVRAVFFGEPRVTLGLVRPTRSTENGSHTAFAPIHEALRCAGSPGHRAGHADRVRPWRFGCRRSGCPGASAALKTSTILDLNDLKKNPGNYTWFDFRPNLKKLILSGDANTEHVSILWYTVANGSVGLHYHAKTESVYVIDGTQTDGKGIIRPDRSISIRREAVTPSRTVQASLSWPMHLLPISPTPL